MKLHQIVFLALFTCSLTSCWTTVQYSVVDSPAKYLGDKETQLIGLSERQVISLMEDVPDRIVDYGNGKVLVYEKIKVSSTSKTTSHSTTSETPLSSLNRNFNPELYQYTGPTIGTSGSSTTTTTQDVNKRHINIFMDAQDRCYDVQSNFAPNEPYRDEVTHKKICTEPNPAILWTWFPIPWVGLGATIWYCKHKKDSTCREK